MAVDFILFLDLFLFLGLFFDAYDTDWKRCSRACWNSMADIRLDVISDVSDVALGRFFFFFDDIFVIESLVDEIGIIPKTMRSDTVRYIFVLIDDFTFIRT